MGTKREKRNCQSLVQNKRVVDQDLVQSIFQPSPKEENKEYEEYSYDHLEIATIPKIMEVLRQNEKVTVQGRKVTDKSILSDTIGRLNLLNFMSENYIVVTDLRIYIFTSNYSLWKRIELVQIFSIQYHGNSNYVVICTNERIPLELFKKEEILLFI